MRFSLRQLEVFVAIARAGSVSQAARVLSLSQSAASTALSELERQFELRLFDRVGRRLQLNELGHALLPRAIELLDRAQAVEGLLSGGEGGGPLRIGATLTIGNYLATLLVSEFMRRRAGCRIRLKVGNTAAIINQVAELELDLGLIEGDCRHPELEVLPWVADELVVFAAPEHPLAKQGRASTEELLRESWVVREAGSGTRATFEQAFRGRLAELDVLLELEHTEAIKRVVESGLALGCISRLALREAFRRGSLAPVEAPELDLGRHFGFVLHRQKYRSPGILDFLALCRQAADGVAMSHEIDLTRLTRPL